MDLNVNFGAADLFKGALGITPCIVSNAVNANNNEGSDNLFNFFGRTEIKGNPETDESSLLYGALFGAASGIIATKNKEQASDTSSNAAEFLKYISGTKWVDTVNSLKENDSEVSDNNNLLYGALFGAISGISPFLNEDK